MCKVCGTFSTRDFVKTSVDGLAEALDGVGGALQGVSSEPAEDGFELGEELFDRVEIWTVGRKVDQNCTPSFDGFSHAGNLVNGDIVHEHDVTSFQGWSEYLFDVGAERLAVHRAFEHERRRHAVVAQRGDQCPGLPVAVQHLLDQAFAARGAAVEAGDAARDAGFIDENEPSGIEPWLPLSQGLAIGCDVRSILLGRVQAFF